MDNGGDVISSYELWWATGAVPGTYAKVATYTGASTISLPSGADTITAGEIYNFKYLAVNARGNGPFSDVV